MFLQRSYVPSGHRTCVRAFSMSFCFVENNEVRGKKEIEREIYTKYEGKRKRN